MTSHRNPIPNKGEEEETQRNEESTKKDLKNRKILQQNNDIYYKNKGIKKLNV